MRRSLVFLVFQSVPMELGSLFGMGQVKEVLCVRFLKLFGFEGYLSLFTGNQIYMSLDFNGPTTTKTMGVLGGLHYIVELVSLGLLMKSVNSESRQIQVKKSVVHRLHAIFRSKLAGYSEVLYLEIQRTQLELLNTLQSCKSQKFKGYDSAMSLMVTSENSLNVVSNFQVLKRDITKGNVNKQQKERHSKKSNFSLSLLVVHKRRDRRCLKASCHFDMNAKVVKGYTFLRKKRRSRSCERSRRSQKPSALKGKLPLPVPAPQTGRPTKRASHLAGRERLL
uniref:Uncharacterized protein n=1 Tax=Cucumis melo TaxID=3656 RepID=A0A9I9EHW7_CUCME